MRDERKDPGVRDLLVALDPGRSDPGYWDRLGARVRAAGGPALARRRRIARATVDDVIVGWWRALVPAAFVAAFAAAIVLLRQSPAPAPVAYVDLDEMLVQGIEAPEMPRFEMTGPGGDIELVNEIY